MIETRRLKNVVIFIQTISYLQIIFSFSTAAILRTQVRPKGHFTVFYFTFVSVGI